MSVLHFSISLFDCPRTFICCSCCSDAWKVCSVPGSCVGNCELSYDNGSKCSCEDNCEILLTCCDDVEEACRTAPAPTPIPNPAPVCSSNVFGDYNGMLSAITIPFQNIG